MPSREHNEQQRRRPTPAPVLDVGTSAGAEAPAPFPSVVYLGDAVSDEAGPFIVYSREFAANRPPVFERFAEARAHAEAQARSTPGFVYFIMSPIGAARVPALGVEAAAVVRFETEGKAS